ncbi:pyridoxal-dependent decarboxylase, pyridoxal binding domain-containing protein [Ditylenchus destructor]|nr:pyridoxal-dependent decarboxylase, pyridoxal binding domain-containing protein [Ditylenchus destructor]
MTALQQFPSSILPLINETEDIPSRKSSVASRLVKEGSLLGVQKLGERQLLVFDTCKLWEKVDGVSDGMEKYSEAKAMARKIALSKMLAKRNEAFAVMNLGTVVERYGEWKAKMPRVKPFYAVKCNNDPVLLGTLAKLGAGFDCASKLELDTIVKGKLTGPNGVIYANTCKTPSYIEYANKIGVRRMTFDCAEELGKIKAYHSDPQLILRIDVTDTSATRPLDVKFGCDYVKEAPSLLKLAHDMDMEIIGISFHVGSGCQDPHVYGKAIGIAHGLFEVGKSIGHKNMYILDLGGGYPGCDNERDFFGQIAAVICDSLNQYFPVGSTAANGTPVQIIAEPGRYFASAAVSVCATVIGATRVPASKLTAKEEDNSRDGYMYYLDDGVYGSFSSLSSKLYTQLPKGQPLFHDENTEEGDSIPMRKRSYPSVVWGPTCDSKDQVQTLTEIPKWKVGDWIYYANMGAYTAVTTTTFNGFRRPQTHYVVGDTAWNGISKRSAA